MLSAAAAAKVFAVVVLVLQPPHARVMRSQEMFTDRAVCEAAALGGQVVFERRYPGAKVEAACVDKDEADAIERELQKPPGKEI